jgi:hypothetical protein
MLSLRKLVIVAAATSVAATQSPTASSATQPGADRDSEGAAVCVGPDSVLRDARADGECPRGQVKVALSTESEFREFSDPWKPRPAPARPPNRFDDLERRLGALEQAALFEVVDKQGRLVFRVEKDRASVYARSGAPVSEMRATAGGSFFAARSTAGGLESFAGGSGDRGGVRVRVAGQPHIDLGRKAAGNHSLTFPDATGEPIAGIGESRAGTGLLVIGDDAGRVRASMSAADGKGAVNIANSIGRTVLSLTQGDTSGGALVIADNAGDTVVKMNTNGRYGAALAGPGAGFPLITGSGLPGSYILGCAGGAACRPF